MSETFSEEGPNLTVSLEELVEQRDESYRPGETLRDIVAIIAARFEVDVCSIYLLEPDRANLVLAATVGLRESSVGQIRMGINEGLAGLVADQVRPVSVDEARKHPRFKYFREAGEDSFQSFLGVPLADRGILQGVLVVQTVQSREFQPHEIRMLTEVASQIGPVVSEARAVDQFIAPTAEKLWSLARNLWWSWDNDAGSLFRELAPARWRSVGQNPIRLLMDIPLRELERRSGELVLHSRVNYTYRRFQEYLTGNET